MRFIPSVLSKEAPPKTDPSTAFATQRQQSKARQLDAYRCPILKSGRGEVVSDAEMAAVLEAQAALGIHDDELKHDVAAARRVAANQQFLQGFGDRMASLEAEQSAAHAELKASEAAALEARRRLNRANNQIRCECATRNSLEALIAGAPRLFGAVDEVAANPDVLHHQLPASPLQ